LAAWFKIIPLLNSIIIFTLCLRIWLAEGSVSGKQVINHSLYPILNFLQSDAFSVRIIIVIELNSGPLRPFTIGGKVELGKK